MSLDPALVAGEAPPPRLELVPPPPLRIVDVALAGGDGRHELRAYLDAKRAFLHGRPEVDHRVLPLGGRALAQALDRLAPDVALLHEPVWRCREVCRAVHRHGGVVVVVEHAAAPLAADARSPVYARALRSWQQRAAEEADAVISAAHGATGGIRLPLRLGVGPAFRPHDGFRGEHVLYAGPLTRDGEVLDLLDAAALARSPWPLRIAGSGPAAGAVQARVRALCLSGRVELRPPVAGPGALAHEYAAAACVVLPATSALAGLEAAACGAPVVAADGGAPAAILGSRAHTYRPDDPADLLAAVERARWAPPDPAGAAALAREHTWERALAAELRELERLAGR